MDRTDPLGSERPPHHQGATAELFAQVYRELHAIARHCMSGEHAPHTLQATALVHEAFLHLTRSREANWTEPTHLLAVAARSIRRILVNHAVARRTLRRGGGKRSQILSNDIAAFGVPAPWDLVAIGEAMESLEQLDARQARIVELRFFGGLDHPEIARVLGVSLRTVEGEWALARAWLRRHIERAEDA